MTQDHPTYRIVHFVPDWSHGSRFAVAAIVRRGETWSVVIAERQPDLGCLGSADADFALRTSLTRMDKVLRERRDPALLGINFALGADQAIPAEVDHPEAWVLNHVLPRALPKPERRLRARRRDLEGIELFKKWNVDHYIHRHFQLKDLDLGLPLEIKVPAISHWVRGQHHLLLMEPLLPARGPARFNQDAGDVNAALMVNYTLFQNVDVDLSVEMVVYLMPGGSVAQREEALAQIKGLTRFGVRIVDVDDPRQTERLITDIRKCGLSGDTLH